MTDIPDIFALPGHLIRRLHQQSTSVFVARTKAAGFDLTPVQFAALSALSEWPDLDQASLAKRIACDRATIGEVVKRLAQRGLVVRRPDDADRRAFKLGLTPRATALLGAVGPVVVAAQADILPNLSPQERAQLSVLMAKALSGPRPGG